MNSISEEALSKSHKVTVENLPGKTTNTTVENLDMNKWLDERCQNMRHGEEVRTKSVQRSSVKKSCVNHKSTLTWNIFVYREVSALSIRRI